MKNFLFLNYAEIKGYRFNLVTNDQPVNLKAFVNTEHHQEENLIFANYRGKMVGALRFRTAVLPSSIFTQPDESGLDVERSKESIVVDLLILNCDALHNDMIIAGLLITLQKYARKNGYDYCIGCSHGDLSEMVRPNKFISRESFMECSNSSAHVIANSDNPFLLDLQRPFVNFGFVAAKKHKISQSNVKQRLLENAA
ncbi:hypothetical protein GCM10009122_12020 [Fulvivirga kasyanovii]|uniref:GNAT family N-acetyltransferase n=1 Tax=Fulvivirga kasyanovii TaxID=396812 RepID=A0ABW9RLE5_9BACT|nr:hypothetical protein [Fulvivirga kasyanovii]MTI24909.1 hypothetical protein [Fulvivirga kasyanovii]